MTCREYYEPLHRYVEGESSPAELQAVEQHLRGCPACRSTLQMLRREVMLLENYFDSVDVPEEVEARVERAFVPRRRRWSRWLPLAAAALVFAAVGALLSLRHQHVATIERVSGEIALTRADAQQRLELTAGEHLTLYEGDRIATGQHTAAALQFADSTAMQIDANTTVVFKRAPGRAEYLWDVPGGQLRCAISETRKGFEIVTPAGKIYGPPAGLHLRVLPLDGSEAARDLYQQPRLSGFSLFRSAWADQPAGYRVVVTVLRGTVTVSNHLGRQEVPAGTKSEMTTGTAPTPPSPAEKSEMQSWARWLPHEVPGDKSILDRMAAPFEDASPEALQPDKPAVPVPLPPQNVTARATLDGIVISWQPGEAKGGPLWYDVYRRDELAGAEGEFVKVNAQPVKGTSFEDDSVSPAAGYVYAVVAVRGGEEDTEAARTIDSPLSAAVKAAAPDVALVYTGGGPDLASIIVRKFHRGQWRPASFQVRVGESIGARRLVRLPDGLGGVEDIDYATGYRLVAIEPVERPGHPGSMCITIEDNAGRRYELFQQ